MKKTLRIGFAMGGGVSLGTFNGAALTQTLKLAVLRGTFTDVRVDCFSGASAGAMSLAVMLRGLVLQTPDELQKARQALTDEFGEEFLQLPEGSDRQRNLLAAQVVQAAQEDIWVRQISIERLLDDGAGPGHGLRHSAGLLNRATVEKIAHDAIRFDTETLDLSGKRLLADRVLFGCALNNLTPILMDARSEFTGNKLFFSSLAEGMTSWAHREMRVFDLMFGNVAVATLDDEKEHPSRWFRYRAGDFAANKTSDLRTRKAWSTIAATAVASRGVRACGSDPPQFRIRLSGCRKPRAVAGRADGARHTSFHLFGWWRLQQRADSRLFPDVFVSRRERRSRGFRALDSVCRSQRGGTRDCFSGASAPIALPEGPG